MTTRSAAASCSATARRATRSSASRSRPTAQVLPDVRAKAPGRGAWIGVTRAELETAIAKGKLKGALARAFKTGEFTIPADLPDADRDRAASAPRSTGSGSRRAPGTLLTGSDQIDERGAHRASFTLLLHAVRRRRRRQRASSTRRGASAAIAKARVCRGLALPVPRTILSLALGRENVVHIGLTDRAAAKRVSEALDRWLHFIGPEPAPVPCETASQGASALPQHAGTPATHGRRRHEEFE